MTSYEYYTTYQQAEPALFWTILIVWSWIMFRWGRRPNLNKWKDAHRQGVFRGEVILKEERQKFEREKELAFTSGYDRGLIDGKSEALEDIRRKMVKFLREQADLLDDRLPSREDEHKTLTQAEPEVFRINDGF